MVHFISLNLYVLFVYGVTMVIQAKQVVSISQNLPIFLLCFGLDIDPFDGRKYRVCWV